MSRIVDLLRGTTLDDILGALALVVIAIFGWPFVAVLAELMP